MYLDKIDLYDKRIKFFYKIKSDVKPIEVKIIQKHYNLSEVIEINKIIKEVHIRNQIGCWVNSKEIWVKNGEIFRQVKNL